MPERPLVSVLIPAYNYAHLLPRTLRSVFSQDYRPIEVIVVDDGSTDATPELLAATDGIVAVRQTNRGLSAARNEAMCRASGKYLQFVDADDLLGRSAIGRRVALLEAYPECPAAICRSALFRRFQLPEPLAWLGREWRHPFGGRADVALRYRNIAPIHAFLVRAQVVRRAGVAFDETLRAVEDYDFWLRLFDAAGLPRFVRKGWVYYRQHAGSMSKDMGNQTRHDLLVFQRLYELESMAREREGRTRRADQAAALLRGATELAYKLWRWQRGSYDDFVQRYLLELVSEVEQCLNDEALGVVGWMALSAARSALRQSRRHHRAFAHGIDVRIVAALGYERSMMNRAWRRASRRDCNLLARLAWRDAWDVFARMCHASGWAVRS